MSEIKLVRKYETYSDYLDHQKEKTNDPVRKQKWLNDEWDFKVKGFRDIFERNKKYIQSPNKALCLGARAGHEVKALIDLGYDAIGIDIVPFDPYTISGDIHDLSYNHREFDLLFTNIFDHSIYPERFCNEMERVLNNGGILIIHLLLGEDVDPYAENIVNSPDSVIKIFKNMKVLVNQKIKNLHDSLNWEIILQKKG